MSSSSPPSKKTHSIPGSLQSPPKLALVPPGKCQFTSEFASVKLIERWSVSTTSTVFRFDLPDKSQPLNLSTCACILAKADIGEEGVVRPYTPISTNDQIGSFDLLVKNYGESAKMSHHLHLMKVNDTIDFKHIDFNVKIQAPFPFKEIGMIVGGTGITPMIQALHAILGDKDSETKVSMLYGSKVANDILGSDMLEDWAASHSERLTVTHVLSDEPGDSEWKGERGFISKEMVSQRLPSPEGGKDVIIFVCGPPPMYNAICGPREDKEISGVLQECGYEASQVYKF
eukprot:CAMPEP_0172503948 /NCGR_PEP_ID=MMETSP1066-20121228/174028_1 /TAXON_ID=671091 /ORGANISM="Coscinodiscus wailesii, Strain CCMP2513" /LENGTH=286 /DNA_ID=CAMNT_0013279901 /DNA_START=190 /DNA_END=1050 /DNA_ORIENTATION=+